MKLERFISRIYDNFIKGFIFKIKVVNDGGITRKFREKIKGDFSVINILISVNAAAN